jgi:hypothetical protein
MADGLATVLAKLDVLDWRNFKGSGFLERFWVEKLKPALSFPCHNPSPGGEQQRNPWAPAAKPDVCGWCSDICPGQALPRGARFRTPASILGILISPRPMVALPSPGPPAGFPALTGGKSIRWQWWLPRSRTPPLKGWLAIRPVTWCVQASGQNQIALFPIVPCG